MKSRTNAQQELMKQQIIEEERKMNQHSRKFSPHVEVTKSSRQNDKIIYFSNKSDIPISPLIKPTKSKVLDFNINKCQSSASYSVISDNCYSHTKSPMDLDFSNLGDDDIIDWSEIVPSLTTTSEEISQNLIDQVKRAQDDITLESYMDTGIEEIDSLKDDQSVSSSMKASTSCPTNISHPLIFMPGHSLPINQQHHKIAHKPIQCLSPVSSGIGQDQKIQWMRDRNKKDCHNRIERKRRDYINNQIQELGDRLPEKLFLNTESKKNKGGILKNSVVYIQQLEEIIGCIQHLEKETQISENAINLFYKRNKDLEDMLVQNGINFEQSFHDKSALQEWFDIHQQNNNLLQKASTIQSSWSPNHNCEKVTEKVNFLNDIAIKSEDTSTEDVLISTTASRKHCSNSISTQVIKTYNSPTKVIKINNDCNNSNFQVSTTPSSLNKAIVNPQSYGFSQLLTKTNIRLSETPSEHISDSPVLSSILIGGTFNKTVSSSKSLQEQDPLVSSGLSHSVPNRPTLSYPINPENISGERYYLIPLSKTKGLQFITNDFKNCSGIIKVNTNMTNNESVEPCQPYSEIIKDNIPKIAVLNSYSTNHNDKVRETTRTSSSHNDKEGSFMNEFQFEDILME